MLIINMKKKEEAKHKEILNIKKVIKHAVNYDAQRFFNK